MIRLSTGNPQIDKLMEGGIPERFFVVATGSPGTGKTIFSLEFINEGLREGEKAIYVTTEESRESIINQAKQFGWDFESYLGKSLIILDALMREREDEWSINQLDPKVVVDKIVEAMEYLKAMRARLVIDSISALFIDKPAMARQISYYLKRTLYKWHLTVLATSQFSITTEESFGFGAEHIADGIIRFRAAIQQGMLKRYMIIQKMRQTNHDKNLWEIDIVPMKGIVLIGKASENFRF